MISHYHLIAWSRDPRAEVVAICDPDLGAGQAPRRGIRHPRRLWRPRRACSPARASTRSTSPRRAKPMPRWSRPPPARGIDVLCQKPLAPTLGGGRGARPARRRARSALMVHENWRFRPWYRSLKRWLEAGELGQLLQADMAMLSSGLLPDATGRRPHSGAPALHGEGGAADDRRGADPSPRRASLAVRAAPRRERPDRAHAGRGPRRDARRDLPRDGGRRARSPCAAPWRRPASPRGTRDRLEVVGSKASAMLRRHGAAAARRRCAAGDASTSPATTRRASTARSGISSTA